MSNRKTQPIFLSSLLALAMATALPASAQESETLTDGQILRIVRTLNDAEIDQADLALDKTDDAQVQSVANMIKADHESSNEQIEMLEDANDELDLDDSATSESLAEMAEQTREGLDELEDAEFACAYLIKQEEGHEHALETVSGKLQPAATNPDVQAFLTASTPKLEHHLEMAKMARESLAACGA